MARRHALGLILAATLTILSACDSAEERAEAHYQVALSHIEAGDVDRAIVELRNVFDLNGRHEAARLTYAGLLRDRGRMEEAYGQYLRLMEQYPRNLEGRTTLAEMALQLGNWAEAERHGTAAIEMAPEAPKVEAIAITLDYRRALAAKDAAAQTAARARAAALIAAQPDLVVARRVVIDGLLRDSDWPAARTAIEDGIAADPDLVEFQMMRLGVLERLGASAEIEAQLKSLIADNPDQPQLNQLLVRWFVAQNRLGDAEAHLRSLIDPEADSAEALTALVAFLAQTRGPAAAHAELGRMVAAGGRHVALLRSMRAGLDFDAGRAAEAIAEMEDILDTAPPSSETRTIKVALAKMLVRDGNPVGARALTEEVLAEAPGEVSALKLRAAWLIEDDRTGDAIGTLRTALGSSPGDPELMTLMANAHERDGNRQLMGDMLALSVDASGYAPRETLRYAAFLSADGRMLPAEGALLNALRVNPADLQLQVALANVYIALRDWRRAAEITGAIARSGTPDARIAAHELTAHRLAAENRSDELLSFLEGLSGDASVGIGADLAIIRSLAGRGDIDAALIHADRALEAMPGNVSLRLVRGAVLATKGDVAQAESVYRALLEDQPAAEQVWMALYGLQAGQGDRAAALETLEAGLAQVPGSAVMAFNKAAELEHAGDIDGAIVLYEDLYARDSNAQVVANNLASLLATYRDDPASLTRAEVIARRLRDTDIAPFQDTYGWIAYRLGNPHEALSYLEPAAASMPDDAGVLYHLAMVYAALDRPAEALDRLQKAATELDRQNPPAYAEWIDAEIARLQAGQKERNN